jgi:hypothetical protein
MTTRVQTDWKVTTGYRILLRIGWAAIARAIYCATAAAVLDSMGVWMLVAGLALGVMLLVGVLPEPVPRDLIIGRRNWVGSNRTR